MSKNFKDFIFRGNIVDMAGGIIVGAAFTTVVKSLVDDIFSPFLGIFLEGVDFKDMYILLKNGMPRGPYASIEVANEAGAVTLNYGKFLNNTISFIVVASIIYLFISMFEKKQKETVKSAPPGPSGEEKILTEIRDILKTK